MVVVSRIAQRIYFCVCFAGFAVKSSADDGTVFDNDSSHHRIGRSRLFALSGKLYAAL